MFKERYIRQEIFSKIGKTGQQFLLKSKVAVVGLGALGTVSAEMLVRAGVGKLVLVDRDVVELTNLQRQALYTEKDIGLAKVHAAESLLKKINSRLKTKTYAVSLNAKNVKLLNNVDLVLDCTDNLYTRYLINEFCRKNKINWIFSSVIGSKGMVKVFTHAKNEPCFSCLFTNSKTFATCETYGILNTVVRVIAGYQVTEALKLLTKQKPCKDLLRLDVWTQSFDKIKVKKNKNCNVCNNKFEYLNGKHEQIARFCSGYWQLSGKFDFDGVKKRLTRVGVVKDCGYYFHFNNIITVFPDRALIKAKTEKDAKNLYSKYIGD